MAYLVLYSFQNFSYWSASIFLIMSSVLRTNFFLMTLSSLCCCRVSRDTFNGKSSESTCTKTQSLLWRRDSRRNIWSKEGASEDLRFLGRSWGIAASCLRSCRWWTLGVRTTWSGPSSCRSWRRCHWVLAREWRGSTWRWLRPQPWSACAPSGLPSPCWSFDRTRCTLCLQSRSS